MMKNWKSVWQLLSNINRIHREFYLKEIYIRKISRQSLTAIDHKELFTLETETSEHPIAASDTQNGTTMSFFSHLLNESEKK